jgi:hypothetical protein
MTKFSLSFEKYQNPLMKIEKEVITILGHFSMGSGAANAKLAHA